MDDTTWRVTYVEQQDVENSSGMEPKIHALKAGSKTFTMPAASAQTLRPDLKCASCGTLYELVSDDEIPRIDELGYNLIKQNLLEVAILLECPSGHHTIHFVLEDEIVSKLESY